MSHPRTRPLLKSGAILAAVAAAWVCRGTLQAQFSADGHPTVAAACVLAGAMVGMLIGCHAIRWLLNFGAGPFPVARIVLEECRRSRGLAVPVGGVMLLLAILPVALDPGSPLRYRIQSYLGYSLLAMGLLLTFATLLVACKTVSDDLRQNQAGDVFGKPLRRGVYLLGKWLGMILLDAIVVAVCGGMIYAGAAFWLARQRPMDDHDASAIHEQVLTARQQAGPEQPAAVHDAALARLRELEEASPAWIAERGGRDVVLKELRRQAEAAWLGIGPLQRRSYVFRGLSPAVQSAGYIQVRWKIESPSAPSDQSLSIGLLVNDRPIPITTPLNSPQTLTLPSSCIDNQGQLTLTFVNVDPWSPEATGNRSMSFSGGDGLMVLYKVGDFGPNLVRALLMLWIRLAFFAMVAVACSTFLSFPVASVLTLTIWTALIGGGLSLEHLGLLSSDDAGADALRSIPALKRPVEFLASQLAGFSQPQASSLLSDGRYIPWHDVARHAACTGVLWTGAAATLACLVLRRKEIARVQV